MPQNFTENPSALIEATFNQIHAEQMVGLPFINERLRVSAVGFTLFEGDWLGVLLTPWALNLMLLPGPDRHWQAFTVGEKIGLKLPSNDYTFIVGEHQALGQYLACSVRSPVKDIPGQKAGLQLAGDLSRLMTALPAVNVTEVDESRRRLLGGMMKQSAL
ncbi:[NiFe]-hydrogenase assembly chaperone HybE [Reinekea marinisedimentorum]|uniref:[NiFe] hydrogenase assembly HybE family chaperone n=1 Tax=Reinekea marinisedimentorum TaxID=230495 RepID=A0A4R3HWW1_9GAMM|nr:[NiFe]-hydrogenase assembly chaperone HybE [Reinekea marinisedimentorum]TCS36751.1 [NiFe] hydrogenase assembly HybE family chaperone [Reinekea marinisedimentorum]